MLIGSLLIVLGLFVFVRQNIKTHSEVPAIYLHGLLAYHLAFSCVFFLYVEAYGGDAPYYWLKGDFWENWTSQWGSRTRFIRWINFPFSSGLSLAGIIGHLLYGLLSFWALRELFVWAFKKLQVQSNLEKSLLLLVFLMPNLHFWTAGIGKEAWIWTGAVMVFSGLLKPKGRWWMIVLGVLISWWVRPVNGAALIVGIALFFTLDKSLSKIWKSLVIGIICLGGAIVGHWLIRDLQIQTFNISEIQVFLQNQYKYLERYEAGSSIPVESYHIGNKLLAMLFRPHVGDLNSWQAYAAMIENSFFLILLSLATLSLLRGIKIQFSLPLLSLCLYGLILTALYALTLSNLGLMMRMKSVYFPFFYLACFQLWLQHSKNKDFSDTPSL
jgi:hypothetical protein